MNRLTLLESEHAILWHYPDLRIIRHQFLKPISGQPFKDVLLRGLAVLQSGAGDRWLSDDRANSILLSEDSDWSHNVWFPLAAAAGWKYWAVILPLGRLGQINMERLAREVAEGGVTVWFFSDPEAGMTWLQQQP